MSRDPLMSQWRPSCAEWHILPNYHRSWIWRHRTLQKWSFFFSPSQGRLFCLSVGSVPPLTLSPKLWVSWVCLDIQWLCPGVFRTQHLFLLSPESVFWCLPQAFPRRPTLASFLGPILCWTSGHSQTGGPCWITQGSWSFLENLCLWELNPQSTFIEIGFSP